MPSPKIAEGFYWVRYTERFAKDAQPFVAHRFAGCWYSPGCSHAEDERNVELLSPRIPPPVELVPIPKAAPHPVPRTMRPRQ